MNDCDATVSCPRIRRRVIGSNVWLLSFGDLVTLMLGFFVAIIAFAMQNPPKTKALAVPTSGTTLAVTPGENAAVPVLRTATIPPEAFDEQSGNLVDKWRNTLKEQLNLDDIQIKAVALFGCVGLQPADVEQDRFAVMGRTLAVTGQLIDMGAPTRGIQVEAPGAGCEAQVQPGAVLIRVTGEVAR